MIKILLFIVFISYYTIVQLTSTLIGCIVSVLTFSGTVGDWKTHFTVAQNEQFDKLHTDILGHLDIQFQYTI